MKIVWISHDPVHLSDGTKSSFSGGWKGALAKKLHKQGLEIYVVRPGKENRQVSKLEYTFVFDESDTKATLSRILGFINVLQPDLVHVHGTEQIYGLIKSEVEMPVVVSLQGFLHKVLPVYFGDIDPSELDRYKSLKERVFRNSSCEIFCKMAFKSITEVKILKMCDYFIGRTSWDRSVLMQINPKAKYYYGREVIRESFFGEKWRYREGRKITLLHGSNTAPLKGLAFALKVIAQLKKMKYNVHLNVVGSMSRKEISFITGNNYKRYISALIRQEDLVSNVSFLGHLNELQMRDAFLNVDAYFQSSFIENSSNMLLEAQVVGCPVIVGLPCGGSSDMLFRSNVFKYELGNINDCIEVIVSNFLNPKKEKNYLNLDEEVMHNMHKYVDGTEIAKEYIFIYSDILGLDVK